MTDLRSLSHPRASTGQNVNMYLLVYGKETRMMTAVPKRAFKDMSQENRFRELVARHITDHSSMKKMEAESESQREYTPKSFNPPDWR